MVPKSKFDKPYCMNEELANDVLLVKILLGYEEALQMDKKFGNKSF